MEYQKDNTLSMTVPGVKNGTIENVNVNINPGCQRKSHQYIDKNIIYVSKQSVKIM